MGFEAFNMLHSHPHSPSSSTVALKPVAFRITVKTSLAANGGARLGLKLLQSFFFTENGHLFGGSQGYPACMLFLFDLTQNSCCVKAFLPGLVVEKYQEQLFNILIS